jgi:hypothetical protein
MPIDPRRYDITQPSSRIGWMLFRLEHRLLTPGSGDVALIRGYLRLKAWRDCTTLLQRVQLVKMVLKLPARALRGSWAAVRQHGGLVEERFGVTRARQLRHLLGLWLRHGIRPDIYYSYQLYDSNNLRRAPSYFQPEDVKIIRMVNLHTAPDEAELLTDKSEFEAWLVRHDLPTVRTVVGLEGGEVLEWDNADRRLPCCDLFSKPRDSIRAMGTARWTFNGSAWLGDSGRLVDEAGLIAELQELSRTRGMLVQRRLRNHPVLDALTPGALSTVRVVTLRCLDGRIEPIVAVCRIPIGDSRTDSFSLGNAAAPVDPDTGRLGKAIRKTDTGSVEYCDRHPDTGVVLEGFQLPHWDRVIPMAIRAHQSLDRLVYVGWDIALLDSGPVIIEANDNPGHDLCQRPTGIPLGETPVALTFVAHLAAAFKAQPRLVDRGGAEMNSRTTGLSRRIG